MEEDLNKIKPAMGGDYLLHEGNDIFRCFRGIYLGRIKEKTPWHLQPKNPEGHLFLRLNESKEIQMYNVRTGDNSGSSIKFYWFSDGYDDPSWPAGQPASHGQQRPANLDLILHGQLARRQAMANSGQPTWI